MTVDIKWTSVCVNDQAKALEFYTKKLGFVKKEDIPVGDARWITVVSKKDQEGTQLVLEPAGGPSVRKELAAYRKALVQSGIPWTQFACDDVRAEHARLAKAGVKFTVPPTDAGPVTIAVFDDTCGNLLQLVQHNK
jgi:predicted enzyme related to lactoylglutathione lyase